MDIMDLTALKLAVIQDNTMFQPTIPVVQPVLLDTTTTNFHTVVNLVKHPAPNVSTVLRIVLVVKLSTESCSTFTTEHVAVRVLPKHTQLHLLTV